MKMAKEILTGLCILLFVGFSHGIQCFTCSGSGCKDAFNSNSSNVKVEPCIGTCAKTKKYDTGHVARFCNKVNHDTGCITTDSTTHTYAIEMCVCAADFCNAATSVHTELTYIVMCAIGMKVIWTQSLN